MKPEDAEEYTQTLAMSVACGWRQIAWGQKIGIPKALGLSTEEWVSRLGGYVKLADPERLFAAITLRADGLSTRQIGSVLGVDHETVRQDLLTGENSPLAKKNKRKQADTPITTGDNSPVLEPLDVLAGLNVSQEAREAADREDQREERRRQRSQLKAERIAPPLPTGAYRLLYADPPWRYEHVKTESRAIENQYPTMDLEAICQLEVPAADDAVLFLWATPPKLAEALQVIDAWGFTYRTCAVWDKEQIGMGYYFRQQHELLLVGARGEAPVPDAPLRLPSLFRSKRSEHSEKPTFVYGYLEAMYPGFTEHDRVELFNRDHRDGWAQWGNEPAEATP